MTVQDASAGDSATLPETVTKAAEQVELVQPDGPGVEEVVADTGYHSDETLVALGAVGVRSHVSEPERGRRCWQNKKTGETPPEKRAAQKASYANRRRVRGRRGRRLQRCRGEVVERSFAHLYETGGMRVSGRVELSESRHLSVFRPVVEFVQVEVPTTTTTMKLWALCETASARFCKLRWARSLASTGAAASTAAALARGSAFG